MIVFTFTSSDGLKCTVNIDEAQKIDWMLLCRGGQREYNFSANNNNEHLDDDSNIVIKGKDGKIIFQQYDDYDYTNMSTCIEVPLECFTSQVMYDLEKIIASFQHKK